jgi:hypothetical protein
MLADLSVCILKYQQSPKINTPFCLSLKRDGTKKSWAHEGPSKKKYGHMDVQVY